MLKKIFRGKRGRVRCGESPLKGGRAKKSTRVKIKAGSIKAVARVGIKHHAK